MIDHGEFITALYRAILGREPDPAGLADHIRMAANGVPLEQSVRGFLESTEYKARQQVGIDPNPLDQAPPMPIDLTLTPDEEKQLWAHMARSWTKLGASEPYHSVLTDPRWRGAQMTRREAQDAFYKTGEHDMGRFDSWLARNAATTPAGGTCVEYGCGVGRCTIWLARRYARVVAMDISAPHLALARKRADDEGLKNIEFVQVRSKAELDRLRGADVFYSHIVLQHNPPPLIAQILDSAFAGLNPAGVAFFQVTTYASGYAFDLEAYLADLREGAMEMHFFPQKAVFELAFLHGLKPLQVWPDGATGAFGRWISTCFLMEKVDATPKPNVRRPPS